MSDYSKRFTAARFTEMLLNKTKVVSAKYDDKPADSDESEEPFVFNKKKGTDFIILNITDPHFSDYDIRLPMGWFASYTIRKLVEEVRPDLITITGDFVCGKSTYYAIDRFTDLMESFGMPWAPVFGNHDGEANCTKEYLSRRMMSCPHCIMHMGKPDMGYGNYVIKIRNEDVCVETLYMMDSHGSQPNEAQKDWLLNICKNDDSVESSCMMHIPLPDYQFVYDEAWNKHEKKWNSGYEAYGQNNEKICCERDRDGNPVERGFLDTAKQIRGMKHIICGHEHMNDWSAEWKGLRLTYTLKVGQGSGFQPGFNGGTIITIDDEGISSIIHRTRRPGRFVNLEEMNFRGQ